MQKKLDINNINTEELNVGSYFENLDKLENIENLLSGNLHLLKLLNEDISDNGYNNETECLFDIAILNIKHLQFNLKSLREDFRVVCTVQ